MTSKNQIRINKSTTISKTSKSLIINEEIEKKVLSSKILKKSITGYKFIKKIKVTISCYGQLLE